MQNSFFKYSVAAFALVLVGAGCAGAPEAQEAGDAMMEDSHSGSAMMEDAGAGLTEGEVLAECPAATAVADLAVESERYIETALGIDMSEYQYTKAVRKSDGRTDVYISTEEIPSYVDTLAPPVSGPGEAMIMMYFRNGGEAAGPGEYTPQSDLNAPLRISADVAVNNGERSSIISLALSGGTASIDQIQDGTICGSFNFGSQTAEASGVFVAEIES